ncbi:hypothetical protein TI39_contig273g00003 [Zymoseptoria brevis]|uniref:Extracellular membrane protein CFEM domain-containing protein n=1 Tax=Zymoseptoria brevis TaxID=1047168 RepID=A0A0F4GXC1_9PEZI|nr:hypothetical protein TI39_contig273g00003 [Zymoseptoria brevis]
MRANPVIWLVLGMATVLVHAGDVVATAETDHCLVCFQTIVDATGCHQPSGQEDQIEACFCKIASMCSAVCHNRLRFDPNLVCNTTDETPDTANDTTLLARGDASKTRFVPSLTRFCKEPGLVDCLLPLPPNTNITVEQFLADRGTVSSEKVKRGHRGSGGAGYTGWCGAPGTACANAEDGEVGDEESDDSIEFTSPFTDADMERSDANVAAAAGHGRGGGGEYRNPFGWCGSPGMTSCHDEEEGEHNTLDAVAKNMELESISDITDKRNDINIDAAARGRGGGGEHRSPFGWCGSPGMICYAEDGDDEQADSTAIESEVEAKRRDDNPLNPILNNPDLCGNAGLACAHNSDHQGHLLSTEVTQEVTVLPTPVPAMSDKTTIFTTIIYHTVIKYKTMNNDEMQPMKRPVSIWTTATTATVTEVEGSHLLVVADATGPGTISGNAGMQRAGSEGWMMVWVVGAVIGMIL